MIARAPRRRRSWSLSLVAGVVLVSAVTACGAGARPTSSEQPPADPVAVAEGETLFEAAEAFTGEGDHVRAEQYYAAAIARGVDEQRVMPRLLRACLATSRIRTALAYAEPYLGRHPDAWSVRYLVASLHLGLGHIEIAKDLLNRVVSERPEQPEPHYLLARVLRDDLAEPASARRHFERYLELAPEGEHSADARRALDTSTPAPAAALPDPAPSGVVPPEAAAVEQVTTAPPTQTPSSPPSAPRHRVRARP